MFVDDEPDVTLSLKKGLEEHKKQTFVVDTFNDPEEAYTFNVTKAAVSLSISMRTNALKTASGYHWRRRHVNHIDVNNELLKLLWDSEHSI